jgi:hypothetical protein
MELIGYCVKEFGGRILAQGEIHATRNAGPVDENSPWAVDGGNGNHHVHGLDPRSSATPCRCYYCKVATR